MKNKWITIGITLSTMGMSTGIAVAAPAENFGCDPIKNLDPISVYAKEVLTRANNGLDYARSAGVADDFLSIMPSWMISVGSAWAGLTDTSTGRTDAVAELNNVSACLHFDLALIDCKIDEVRTEIRQQSSRGSFVALIRLTSLLEFLNERRQQLTIGALDPQYPDPSWGYRYSFDKPSAVWCSPIKPNETCKAIPIEDCMLRDGTPYQTLEACERSTLPRSGTTGDKGRMCPFDSDYAPAFDNGYGCDIETMEPRKAYPPVNAELEGLKSVSGALAAYRKTAVEIQKLQQQMDELFGTASSSSSSSASRKHLNAFGCGWMGGWCDDDISMRCTSDADCADTCVFSDKVCDKNRAIRCTDDSQCGNNGPCMSAQEPTLRSVRGNFSLDRDQMSILTSFLGIRSQQEISRVFREDLQTAAELPASDQTKRERRAYDDADPSFALFRSGLRSAVQTWSRIQARFESLMYPEDVDNPQEISHSLSDLHANIGRVARLAKDKEGVRAFVTNYASFLRRSCIYRPCNQLLEQSIRLLTADECFPYTNGEYLNDTEENPRWEKCKNEAEIK